MARMNIYEANWRLNQDLARGIPLLGMYYWGEKDIRLGMYLERLYLLGLIRDSQPKQVGEDETVSETEI